MTVINFFGALTNGLLNYSENLTNDFHATFIFIGAFCCLYFLTARLKINLDNSLKLPIIRTVLWTIFLSKEHFIKLNANGEVNYSLFLNNS